MDKTEYDRLQQGFKERTDQEITGDYALGSQGYTDAETWDIVRAEFLRRGITTDVEPGDALSSSDIGQTESLLDPLRWYVNWVLTALQFVVVVTIVGAIVGLFTGEPGLALLVLPPIVVVILLWLDSRKKKALRPRNEKTPVTIV